MNLREYFETTGVKQSFFANKLGVKPPTLVSWMCKRTSPTLEMLVKVEKLTEGKVKISDWVEKEKIK